MTGQTLTRPFLHLFGHFGVVRHDGPAAEIRISSRMACALIAYLAIDPEHSANRERLANLLWSDRIDRLARQNLRQCLATLRRDLADTVPELIVVDDDIVSLRIDLVAVDALEFTALAGSSELTDRI